MHRHATAPRALRLLTLLLLALSLLAAAPVRRITLDVKDADVHNVLRMLADAGKVNLVVSDRVQGRVTLRLRDVPWQDALQVVLTTRGLGLERVGSILQIDTLEAIRGRAEAQLAVQTATTSARPLETLLIPLSYASADELRPLVQGFLSERGKVTSDARTNTLIVTDDPERLEKVLKLVGRPGTAR